MREIPTALTMKPVGAGEAKWKLRSIASIGFLLILTLITGCFGLFDSTVEHENVAFGVAPSGKQIVFSSAKGDLFLFDLTTKAVQQLTKTELVESTPSFSPDGKSVVCSLCAKDSSANIESIATANGEQVQLTHEKGVNDRLPVFSPDGKRIAFIRATTNRDYSLGGRTRDDWDVCIMDADGKNSSRLTNEHYYGIGGLTFSPDGSSVYYSADANRAASVLVATVFHVSIDGKSAVQHDPVGTTAKGAWAAEPSFSPDGKLMAVISDRVESYAYDVMLIDVATNKATSLGVTKIATYNSQPKFISNSEILYLAGEDSNAGSRPISALRSICTDGTNMTRIADSLLFTNPMRFSTQQQGKTPK
jgi:Tol biopolymer transport system component